MKNEEEIMMDYDEKGNVIYMDLGDGDKSWWKIDKEGNCNNITKQEFKQIERTKLYLNNKKCSRFELMDI